LRAGDDRRNNGGIESADPLEEVANLFVLELQLGFVGNVLILAAATIAKVETPRPKRAPIIMKGSSAPGASVTAESNSGEYGGNHGQSPSRRDDYPPGIFSLRFLQ